MLRTRSKGASAARCEEIWARGPTRNTHLPQDFSYVGVEVCAHDAELLRRPSRTHAAWEARSSQGLFNGIHWICLSVDQSRLLLECATSPRSF